MVRKVYELARDKKNLLVPLDSYHTHDHGLEELKIFSPLVTPGSYRGVFDTVIAGIGRISSKIGRGAKATTRRQRRGNSLRQMIDLS